MIGSTMLATWFPEAASSHAAGVDGPFRAVYFLAVCALVILVALAVVQMRLYRRQDRNQQGGITGRANPVLQTLWVLGAVGLVVFAFTLGVPGFIDQTTVPYGAYPIQVTAKQWAWEFAYPNGHVDNVLHVPVDRPVVLKLTTADVAHSIDIPALRVNQAITPGQDSQTWFEATKPGKYDIQSNIYSGDFVAEMKGEVEVHNTAGFLAWVDEVSDIFKGRTFEEVGELLYTRHGCSACHSIDGTQIVGPTFKDVYGHEFDTVEGTRVLADDAYIRESILDPTKSVISGFQPVMTSYKDVLDDKEITAITAWLKTLSSKGGAAPTQEGN